MSARSASLKSGSVLGALIGYGFLAMFLALVTHQLAGWFREGQWTHVGLGDLVQSVLGACCVRSTESVLGRFVAWLDAPDSWLGLHRAFEWIPASFGLFALSILGNCLFIYCRDRLRQR